MALRIPLAPMLWVCGTLAILGWFTSSLADPSLAKYQIRKTKFCDVVEYGAKGDGRTLDTLAFKKAIEACRVGPEAARKAERRRVEIHAIGRKMAEEDDPRGWTLARDTTKGIQEEGNVIFVPPGEYLIGPVNLTSYQLLYLTEKSTILASTRLEDYEELPAFPSYGVGREHGRAGRYQAVISAFDAHGVGIVGGTINGQGKIWWDTYRQHLNSSRPRTISLYNTTSALVSNVTIKDSPFWTVHPIYSTGIVIEGVTILAPASSPNTDGVDPDSSLGVDVRNCTISTGDDAIAVKSGWDYFGEKFGSPSAFINVSNSHTGHGHGLSIGSELSGGVKHIQFNHIQVTNGPGGRVKYGSTRGGFVRNVTFTGLEMAGVNYVLRVSDGYNAPNPANPPSWKKEPHYTNVDGIVLEHTRVSSCSQLGVFSAPGSPTPIRSVYLFNDTFPANAPPFKCSNAKGRCVDVNVGCCF